MDQFGNFRLINAYYDSYSKTTSGNAGIRSHFQVGPVGHAVNFAFTGYYQENGNAYVANTPAQSVPSNIYNPSPLPVVTGARLPPRKANEVTLRSFAIADTMSFLNETVLFTVGARHQRVEQDAFSTTTGAQSSSYGAEAVTPLAGLVVKPLQNVSLYANYAEGLSQGIIVPPSDFANRGAILAPYKSKQQEAGIKVDWGTITTTAAVFQIARPLLITTPANFRVYDGEQQNRGLELNAYGLLLPGFARHGQRNLPASGDHQIHPPRRNRQGRRRRAGQDVLRQSGLGHAVGVRPLAQWSRDLYVGLLSHEPQQSLAEVLRLDPVRRRRTLRDCLQRTPRHVTRQHREPASTTDYWLTTGSFVTVGSPRTYILSAAFDL